MVSYQWTARTISMVYPWWNDKEMTSNRDANNGNSGVDFMKGCTSKLNIRITLEYPTNVIHQCPTLMVLWLGLELG